MCVCYCIVIILDVTNSILVCISPLTVIMQEQSQRFCKGIKSGFVGGLQKDQAVQQKVLNGYLDLVYILVYKVLKISSTILDTVICFTHLYIRNN